MGIHMSAIKNLLVYQSAKEPCFPMSPYVKFPKHLMPVGEDGLVTDILILPEKLHRITDDGTWYWWSDAQFIPFNDSCFVATTSAFLPRPAAHWTTVRSMPNGRIMWYRVISHNRFECQAYGRTNSTVYPKVQPHPLGQLVSYCGTGEVVVMSVEGDPIFQKSRDLSNAVHVFCAVAKNGVSFACLKKGSGTFFLETYVLDRVMMGTGSTRCHNICPGFLPSRTVTDSVQCKFSPDSKYITVSSSTGFLFTVTRFKLEKSCIICPEMVEHALSSSAAFDYDPRFPFQIMSVATAVKNVHTINVETNEILLSCDTDEFVDCLQYCPDGSLLAMGFNNFDIAIHNSKDLSCVHSIPMSSLCEDQFQRRHSNYPAVVSLSFSQNGEHLASSSCDGHLRLWRVSRLFSLQELCRDVILTCLPVREVKHLQLPTKIKDFLLYKYF